MEKYLALWDPVMEEDYRRFGDNSYMRELTKLWMLEFFRDRYDLIIPMAEEHAKE